MIKTTLLYLLLPFLLFTPGWLTDFEEAKTLAAQKHQLILLNFSGSDWCSPCIRLKKEIFESDRFKNFADSAIVLVNADFPRLKKNQLVKEQVAKNESLAGRYNREGKFPFTLLLDEEGKVIKSWEGVPNYTPEQWVTTIKNFNAAH